MDKERQIFPGGSNKLGEQITENDHQQSILDSLPAAVYQTDADGYLTYLNNNAILCSGHNPKIGVDRWCDSLNLFHTNGQPMLHESCPMAVALKKGQIMYGREIIAEYPDGERKWFKVFPSLMRDNKGKIVGGINMLIDITEEKTIKKNILQDDHQPAGFFLKTFDLDEQKQASEDLKSFTDSFEIQLQKRTKSLLVFQDHLRTLADHLNHTEEKERYRLASELQDNVGQLLSLCKMKIAQMRRKHQSLRQISEMTELTDLLNEAIKSTRELMFDLKPPPTDVSEDFGKVLKWISQRMKKHGLKVTIEDDYHPKLLDEELRMILVQSLKELLFNVIKHAGVQSARVVVSLHGDQLQIIVADKGSGFNFDPTNLIPSKKGGFGLFNIRERVNNLGGSLRINTEPGRGTEVLLTIPVKPEEKKGLVVSEGDDIHLSEINEPVRVIKVLLADDHKMMRKGLRRLIEEEKDLEVIGEASDGLEAVRLAKELKPDVIIMDVNMPEMNGIEATRRITETGFPVRIIGLSFHKEEEVARSIITAGASVYMTKSDVFEILCETIRSEGLSLY